MTERGEKKIQQDSPASMLKYKEIDAWQPEYGFELDDSLRRKRIPWLGKVRRNQPLFASTSTTTMTEPVITTSSAPAAPPPPPSSKVNPSDRAATLIPAAITARFAGARNLHLMARLQHLQHWRSMFSIGSK